MKRARLSDTTTDADENTPVVADESEGLPEPSPSSPRDDDRKSHWKDVSKMLGYLKYHASDKNNDKEDMSMAKQALMKYGESSGIDKSRFLEEYTKNKGTLKWVRYFECISAERTIKKTTFRVATLLRNN